VTLLQERLLGFCLQRVRTFAANLNSNRSARSCNFYLEPAKDLTRSLDRESAVGGRACDAVKAVYSLIVPSLCMTHVIFYVNVTARYMKEVVLKTRYS
jgi:hypothetical protein